MVDWKRVRYFKPQEFDDPSVPGSGELINPITLFHLEQLREHTGWPIITHAIVGGCVDMKGTHGHAKNSYHLAEYGALAVDFHFETRESARAQLHMVCLNHFTGIGAYFNWHWEGKELPIGFHVDTRPVRSTQLWTSSMKGVYHYLLP